MAFGFDLYDKRVAAVCAILVAGVTLAAQGLGHAAQAPPPARTRMAFSHDLPHLDGTRLQAKLVEITYGPGEASAPHTHPCPLVGYVLEGAVRMRVGDSPEVVYKVGDTFYEDANAKHLVSANASSTARARFLAYFTCDHDAPLTMEMHDGDK